MAINYCEACKCFRLDTEKTTYVIGIADAEKFVGHAYYGKKLGKDDVSYLMRTGEAPFTPETNSRDRLSFLDCFPQEFPTGGVGDFRESAVVLEDADGHRAAEFHLESFAATSIRKTFPIRSAS